MKVSQVIWPRPVRNKLLAFRSDHFTPEEAYNYIVRVISDTEKLLLNPVLGKVYTEEKGEYAGFMRLVVRKFKLYVEMVENDAVVVAVKYPGEK
jgi:plasmid stabilization system protein ParE